MIQSQYQRKRKEKKREAMSIDKIVVGILLILRSTTFSLDCRLFHESELMTGIVTQVKNWWQGQVWYLLENLFLLFRKVDEELNCLLVPYCYPYTFIHYYISQLSSDMLSLKQILIEMDSNLYSCREELMCLTQL